MHRVSPCPTHTEPLLSPRELKQKLPTTITQSHFIEQSRKDTISILDGKDGRILLIIGPCSVHDMDAALHYAAELKKLSEEVADVFFVIMRVYFEKARSALGWKGMMYDPHLDGTHDIVEGMYRTRKLMLALADMRLPAAAEILDPVSGHYFGDMLTWGCIGARTSSSQIHRQAASGLTLPIGFKNNTDGNVDIAAQAVLTAGRAHAYVGIDDDGRAAVVRSHGNANCHVVLRGGEKAPNYDPASVSSTLACLKRYNIPEKILIDCSHDNSRRDHTRQAGVLESILQQISAGNSAIRGVLLESYLSSGNQTLQLGPCALKYGVSITDPCLDWPTTEMLVLNARQALQQPIHPSRDAKEALLV